MSDFLPEDRARKLANRWLAHESADLRKLCSEELTKALREAIDAGKCATASESKPH